MKAWVLHKINDIRFEDVEVPEICENEVLVKVRQQEYVVQIFRESIQVVLIFIL